MPHDGRGDVALATPPTAAGTFVMASYAMGTSYPQRDLLPLGNQSGQALAVRHRHDPVDVSGYGVPARRPGVLSCPIMRFLPPGAGSRRALRRLAAFTRRALLVAVCLAVLPSGVAQAASPKGSLLKTGRLAATSCPEPPIIDLGIPRTREYLTAAMKCLNKSWSAHFARAGLRFRKPTVAFYEEPAQRVCGIPWPVYAAAFYCTERATLVFPLTGDWIENRTDLYPLKTAAHEYGHHLQSLTGIRDRYEARVRSDHAHQAELGRRYELQADCLSGVFLGSVRRSLVTHRAGLEVAVRRAPRQRRRPRPPHPRHRRQPGPLVRSRLPRGLSRRLRHLDRRPVPGVLTRGPRPVKHSKKDPNRARRSRDAGHGHPALGIRRPPNS